MSKQTDLINVTDAITVSGSNVGIGTSSPTSAIDVRGEAVFGSGTDGVKLTYSAGNSTGIIDTGFTSTGLEFRTGNSFAAKIESSGNVGIGTSSPSNTLSLEGSGTGLNINSTNDEVKKIAFENSGVLTGYIGSSTSSPLRFLNGSGTERMRIDSSGNLLVGTTSIPNGTSSYGSAFVSESGNRRTLYLATSASSNGLARFHNSNGQVGTITVSGSSTSYNTSSDYRLKTDAQPMTGASARVQALNPVNFEWISSGDRVDGFLAHEAQEVVPEAVSGTKDAMRDEEYEVTAAVYEDIIIAAVLDEDGNELEAERTEQQLVTEAVMGTRSVPDYQGIDQSKLVPLLTAALQEALTEITDLKARVIALEGN